MKRMNLYNFKNGQEPQPRFPGGNRLSTVIFWGSLWGLAEATLGYLLHLIKIPGLAGAVMATIAFYFLYRLYQPTGSAAAVIGASLVAAGLKSLDIVVSPVGLMDVINPVQAIIIEGLAAAASLKILERGPNRQSTFILSGLLFSFGSNLVYGLAAVIESSVFHSGNIFQTGPVSLARFFLLSPLVTAFIVTSWLLTGKVQGQIQYRMLKQAASVRTDSLAEIEGQPQTFLDRLASRPVFSLAILALAILSHFNQLWFL